MNNPERLLDSKQIYLREIFDNRRFKEWDNLCDIKIQFENNLAEIFRHKAPRPKLVGSAATGTMREGSADLDYALAFDGPVDTEDILDKLINSDLEFYDINQNKKYGYLKLSGVYLNTNFVLVPMSMPDENVNNYEQDAYFHSDFINTYKKDNHAETVILLKEFFDQIGVYKEVKGIGCEMLSLYFQDFDNAMQHIASSDKLRINFSNNQSVYCNDVFVIDYPILGGRSFTEKVSPEMFYHIKECANKYIRDYRYLIGVPSDN